MPAGVAKQMVLDILELNMNPRLNMCSWLTTHMEAEAEEIISRSLYINAIDAVEYPSAAKMAQRCVTMLANLWNAPQGFKGTETVGSTEACYLGALAAKKNWQAKRKAAGLSTDRPNMIFGHNAQIAWQKACSYFDIEPRFVEVHEGQLVMDPAKVAELADDHTVCVAAMVGSTYNGQFEKVEEVNAVLEDLKSSKGLDIPIHVDAAGGGLVAPLIKPDFMFDFRLPHVKSISLSGHKYGMVYPGIAFVVFRSKEWIPSDMEFTVDYLGKPESHLTMNFSRPGCMIAAQYYNFVRLGKEGYTHLFRNLMHIYDYLVDGLEKCGHFEILSTGDLPVVAFRLKPGLQKQYDEYDIMYRLKEFRFMVPAYKMAPKAQHIRLLRACIRPGFDLELAQFLIDSLNEVIDWLDKHGAAADKGPTSSSTDFQRQHALC